MPSIFAYSETDATKLSLNNETALWVFKNKFGFTGRVRTYPVDYHPKGCCNLCRQFISRGSMPVQ